MLYYHLTKKSFSSYVGSLKIELSSMHYVFFIIMLKKILAGMLGLPASSSFQTVNFMDPWIG